MPRVHAKDVRVHSAPPFPSADAFTPSPRTARSQAPSPGKRKAQKEKGKGGSGHPAGHSRAATHTAHARRFAARPSMPVRNDYAARRKRSASSRRRVPPMVRTVLRVKPKRNVVRRVADRKRLNVRHA